MAVRIKPKGAPTKQAPAPKKITPIPAKVVVREKSGGKAKK